MAIDEVWLNDYSGAAPRKLVLVTAAEPGRIWLEIHNEVGGPTVDLNLCVEDIYRAYAAVRIDLNSF